MTKIALTPDGQNLTFIAGKRPRRRMSMEELRARVPEEDLSLSDEELRAKYVDETALPLRRNRRVIIDQAGNMRQIDV